MDLPDHCVECGAFPTQGNGPLTKEVARLHTLMYDLKHVVKAAVAVSDEMTTCLNSPHGRVLITPGAVMRWRNMLSQAIEAAQERHNP